jgi:hypothetical protein
MKISVSNFTVALLLAVLFSNPSLGAPLTGSGLLPFPGATGDPPRDTYQPAGPGSGPFTGTWPGLGPNAPASAAWWGTFSATGAMPHTPPSGPSVTGTAIYDFTLGTGGYAPGALPIGTYFHFGDVDNGSASSETFRLTAFDPSLNLITTPWLDTPFAATAGSVPSDLPNYNYAGGVYDFDGNFVPGNPAVSVFLKNNVALGKLIVTRSATTEAFILAAPPAGIVPEPSSMLLVLGGVFAFLAKPRRCR